MNKEMTLPEVQKVSLEILKVIDKICQKENMKYYLAYGTLIGAVRHKGFIPWDDDIDIMMPRDDYERFIKFFNEHQSEYKNLKLFTTANKNYPYMISRLSNDDYVLDVHNEKSYGMGIFVDIYPMDGVAKTYNEMLKRIRKSSKYSSLCFLSTREKYEKGQTKSKLKLLVKRPAFAYAKAKGKDYFINKLENMRKKYTYDECNYVGCMVWGTDREKGIYEKEWFEETIYLPFEDGKFAAPKGYDKVLTRLYKNYMELPPKEKQIPHHEYLAYKKETK